MKFVNGVTLNGERTNYEVSGLTQRELWNTPIVEVRNVRVTSRRRGARKVAPRRYRETSVAMEAWIARMEQMETE
jgi:hypothetical protein